MANLSETSTYDAGVYQLETTDPIIGGPTGIANSQAKALANRTKWLKDQNTAVLASISTLTSQVGDFAGTTTIDGSSASPNLVSGNLAIITGRNSSFFTPTLPLAETAGAGAVVAIVCNNANTTSGAIRPLRLLTRDASVNGVKASGSDTIVVGQWYTASPFFCLPFIDGDYIILVSDGVSKWVVAQHIGTDNPYIGNVSFTARNTPPAGFLAANGAAVSRTTYARLFEALGTTFGVGDGSTTFNLPDVRGNFIRGWDNGAGVDTNTVVLTGTGTNSTVNITGLSSTVGLAVGMSVSGTGITGGTTIASIVSSTAITLSSAYTGSTGSVTLTFATRIFGSLQLDAFKSHSHFLTQLPNVLNSTSPTTATIGTYTSGTSVATSATGDTETRPRNIALLGIIKF